MKTIKKPITLTVIDEEINMYADSFSLQPVPIQIIKMQSNEIINSAKLTHFIDVEVPESLKEFREHHHLSKSDLLKWLNENYNC